MRIELIEASLRCFTCGMIGLLPVVGLPFAVSALFTHFRTWSLEGEEFNAGKRYLFYGFVLGWIGGIMSLFGLVIFALLIFEVLVNYLA